MLELRAVTKRYRGVLAVDNISFTVNRGEVVGYLGPNGSGKSTTVHMVVGLLEPSSGSICLDGHSQSDDLVAYKRRIGYVPEEPYLYTHLTAARSPVIGSQNRSCGAAPAAAVPRSCASRSSGSTGRGTTTDGSGCCGVRCPGITI
jgi:ABC-2 type transport system ATP-binding protein